MNNFRLCIRADLGQRFSRCLAQQAILSGDGLLIHDERFQLLIVQADLLRVTDYFDSCTAWQTFDEWVEEKACAIHAWQQNDLRWIGLHVIVPEEVPCKR